VSGWWSRLRNAYFGLEPRERLLVSVGIGLFALFLVWTLVLSPLIGVASQRGQRLEVADQRLRVMEALRRDYDDVRARLADVERRIQSGPKGNLRTTLESLASQASVKVESMEPQASPSHPKYHETKVEVGLANVTLAQTVTYLHQIETAPQALSVKSLRIRTRPEQPELLEVSFTVSSFEPI
jgi:general secretion pathway protein M